jgi:cyclic beta-1,2-glucan synthetase
VQYQQLPSTPPIQDTPTRAPIRRPATAPSTTSPTIWWPGMTEARRDGSSPSTMCRSVRQINHARTPAAVQRYAVEPYVVAADVYAEPQHIGRGGWTWYTGSAGWMYRAGLESILGLRQRGTQLLIDPCLPRAWPGFEMVFRYGSTRYDIVVENPRGVSRGVTSFEIDGAGLETAFAITLADDGSRHRVRIVLG